MIELADVNAYYQDFHVLKNVSLTVEKGQIVVMLGPNGHGKSTVLKSICGLVEKVSGVIRFEGETITGLGSEKLVDMGITYIAENR